MDAARWVADPLHRVPMPRRMWIYAWLGVYFVRLAIWYGVADALLGGSELDGDE